MKAASYLSEILNTIYHSDIIAKPFPHVVRQNFLPLRLANDLAQAFFAHDPNGTDFVNSGSVLGYDNKDRFVIEIRKNSPFLLVQQLNEWFSDRAVFIAVSKQFSLNLNVENVVFRGQVTRDTSNYSLGIHTDHPSKLFTIIVYLTPNASTEVPGTTLYSTLNGFESSGLSMYVDTDARFLEESYTVPHRFNSALIFARSNTSFHGVKKVFKQQPRLTLQLNYFEDTIELASVQVK